MKQVFAFGFFLLALNTFNFAVAADAEVKQTIYSHRVGETDPSRQALSPANAEGAKADLLFPYARESKPLMGGGFNLLNPESAPPASTSGFERDMDCLRPLRAAERARSTKYFTPVAPKHKTAMLNMSPEELGQTLREQERQKVCAEPIPLTEAMVAEKALQITINLDTCKMDMRFHGKDIPFEAVDRVPGAINYGDGSKLEKVTKKPAKTVTGCFQPNWYDENHFSNAYNNAPMGKSLFFVRGQAIHEGEVGSASHACIHATKTDMNLIFGLISRGDKERHLPPAGLEGTSVCVVGSGAWNTHKSCNAIRAAQKKSMSKSNHTVRH